VVINKGLGHADGLGTVGRTEAIKHRAGEKRNQVAFLLESLKKTERKKRQRVRKSRVTRFELVKKRTLRLSPVL